MHVLQCNIWRPSPSSPNFSWQQYWYPSSFSAPSPVSSTADCYPPCYSPRNVQGLYLLAERRQTSSSLLLSLPGTVDVLCNMTGVVCSPLISWLNLVLIAFELGEVGPGEAAFAYLPGYEVKEKAYGEARLWGQGVFCILICSVQAWRLRHKLTCRPINSVLS